MKEKYIEERIPRLFAIKSRYPDTMIVLSAESDINIPLSSAEATELIEHTERVYKTLVSLAQAFDEADHQAFSKFWYQELARK